MLTSESELIDRRYMETPTMTAGPEKKVRNNHI